MFAIGGIGVPPIDEIPDEQLTDILSRIIAFAKSNPQGSERETFDFKRTLDLSDAHEIRKDFSSFANTSGGLIIVGVDEKSSFQQIGVTEVPPDERLSLILSTESYIRPVPRFSSRVLTYEGKTMLLYHISESRIPIEIRKRGSVWQAHCRYNNTTRTMSNIDLILKFYGGVKKLPDSLRVNIPELGFHLPNDDSIEPSITWTARSQGELHEWLKLAWMPVVPIPLPIIPFEHQSEVYGASTRWYGEYEESMEILKSIENTLHELGISQEFWTVPMAGAKTLQEDHRYTTGCGANNLQTCLRERRDQHITNFVWILFSSTIVMVVGTAYDKYCEIEVQSLFNFVPNNFPLISIDEAGRVVLQPLPAHKIYWWAEDRAKKWELPIANELFWEDVPDEILAPLPSAKIKGYLGGRPNARNYDMPFRGKGLTVLEIGNSSDKSSRGTLPLATNLMPISCVVGSAPRGLNDLNEVKVAGMGLSTLLVPWYPGHDFAIIFFNVRCQLSQSKSHRMVAGNSSQ